MRVPRMRDAEHEGVKGMLYVVKLKDFFIKHGSSAKIYNAKTKSTFVLF
jgi:hypothetical protein